MNSDDSHTKRDASIACLIYHKGSRGPSQALKQHGQNEYKKKETFFSSTSHLITELKNNILVTKCKEKRLNKMINIFFNPYDMGGATEIGPYSTSPPLILTALNMSNSEYP